MKNLLLFLIGFCPVLIMGQTNNYPFTSGTLSQGGAWLTTQLAGTWSAGISDTSGGLYFNLYRTDPIVGGSYRAELNLSVNNAISKEQEWFACEIQYPSWLGFDTVPEIHFQVQDTTTGSKPPYGIWLIGNQYYVRWEYFDSTGKLREGINLLGTLNRTLNKFIVQYRRSYRSDGIFRVWFNGKLKYERLGANISCINGKPSYGQYQKIGLYKWRWKFNDVKTYFPGLYKSRHLRIRNVTIGSSAATLTNFSKYLIL